MQSCLSAHVTLHFRQTKVFYISFSYQMRRIVNAQALHSYFHRNFSIFCLWVTPEYENLHRLHQWYTNRKWLGLVYSILDQMYFCLKSIHSKLAEITFSPRICLAIYCDRKDVMIPYSNLCYLLRDHHMLWNSHLRLCISKARKKIGSPSIYLWVAKSNIKVTFTLDLRQMLEWTWRQNRIRNDMHRVYG